MVWETRDVERLVRLFLGLPTAAGYFYARHFSPVTAEGLLTVGLLLLGTGLLLGRKETARTAAPSVGIEDAAFLIYGF